MSAFPVTVCALTRQYGDLPRATACGVEDPRQMLSGFGVFRVRVLIAPLAQGTLVVSRHREDEGRTWIRGHHAPHSEEAQALVAAWMLLRDA